MVRKWLEKIRGTRSRKQADSAIKEAEESIAAAKDRQPQLNALAEYLENRKNQNGFGEDFYITLSRPRGSL